MKPVNIQQNTPEWHEWRANVYGASDCAAMLGISPYKTREALIREKATGEKEAVNDYIQAVFDAGHEAESAIMPHLEERIGEPLIAHCGVYDGTLIAASFDGMTFGGDLIVEHKLLRDSDASRKRFTMAQLGELQAHDMAQVQQQLMVSGADKCLFVVSDGTPENIAIAEVLPDKDWFERIEKGWQQFAQEVEAYQCITIDDGDWQAAAQDYLTLGEQIKALEAKQKETRLRLEEMAEQTGAKKITGGGIVVQRVKRAGSIDYKSIPELAGVNLDDYRKAGSEYWKVS